MGWYSEAELSWGFCIPKDRLARLFRCLRKHYRVKAKPKSKTEQEEQPKPAKRPRVEGAEDKDEEEKEDKSEEEDKEDDDDEDEDDYEDDYVNEKELDEYLSRVLDDEKYNRAFRFRCMSDVIEGYGVFGGSGRYAEGGGVEEVVIAHTESSYFAVQLVRPSRESEQSCTAQGRIKISSGNWRLICILRKLGWICRLKSSGF